MIINNMEPTITETRTVIDLEGEEVDQHHHLLTTGNNPITSIPKDRDHLLNKDIIIHQHEESGEPTEVEWWAELTQWTTQDMNIWDKNKLGSMTESQSQERIHHQHTRMITGPLMRTRIVKIVKVTTFKKEERIIEVKVTKTHKITCKINRDLEIVFLTSSILRSAKFSHLECL